MYVARQVSYKVMSQTMTKIIKMKKKVELLWAIIINYINLSPEFTLYYHWYIKSVTNNNSQDLKEEHIVQLGDNIDNYYKDTLNLEKMNLKYLVFTDHCVALKIDISYLHSADQGYIPARILDITQNCYKNLGYKSLELIGNSINIIMPENIAEVHDEFLQNYTLFNRSYIDNRNVIDTVVVNKEGSLIPVTINIKTYTNLSGIIEMIGLIKFNNQTTEHYEYIMVDEKGEFICSSEGIWKLTNIKPDLIKKTIQNRKNFNIAYVAPGLIDPIVNFIYDELNGKVDIEEKDVE